MSAECEGILKEKILDSRCGSVGGSTGGSTGGSIGTRTGTRTGSSVGGGVPFINKTKQDEKRQE